jgi:beta-lactamase class A
MTTTDTICGLLNQECDLYPFKTGWSFHDLVTGETANRFGDLVVPAASTRKVAILMTAMQSVNRGELSLEEPVTIDERWQISDSGVFQFFRPGFTITMHDVLLMMIIVSDNACTGIVCDRLGLDAINRFSQAVGMTGTVHREGIPQYTIMSKLASGTAVMSDARGTVNETTPNDMARLLHVILRASADAGFSASIGVTPALAELALEMLSRQRLRARLPFLLPGDTRVAHKTGTSGTTYNDAGIVYRGDMPRFILAVYTSGVPAVLPDGRAAPGATSKLIGTLARLCWDNLA